MERVGGVRTKGPPDREIVRLGTAESRKVLVTLGRAEEWGPRRLLRQILPVGVRTGLRSVEARASKVVAKVLVVLVKACPARVGALLKENLRLTAVMDGSNGEIRLAIDSELELTMRANSSRKEPETADWIRTHVQPGDVVYDIGANVGCYSLLIDFVHSGTCEVYAFEPSYANFAQLNKNIELNGCQGRVVPYYIALSDATGLGVFEYSSTIAGAARHSSEGSPDSKAVPNYRQSMPMFRLDDFRRQFALPAPHHLKLDVDGPEYAILRGAGETLADVRLKSVLVEIEEGRPGGDMIGPWLAERGFVLHSRHVHGIAGSRTANSIFVRKPPGRGGSGNGRGEGPAVGRTGDGGCA